MPVKGTKIPPVCSKCNLSHWPFRPCSEGVTYKQIGYDMEVKGSGYPSTYARQPRETGYASQAPSSVRERSFYRGED